MPNNRLCHPGKPQSEYQESDKKDNIARELK